MINHVMTRLAALAFLLCGVPAAFCAEAPAPAAPPPPAAAAPAFDRLAFQDSGGFTGQGSGKRLTLSGGGQLTVKRRNGPAKTIQLQDQELTAVRQAVAAVDWKTVEPIYRSRGADLMINELTITIGGQQHQTHADQLAKLPPALKELFQRLNALYRRYSAANQPQE